MSGPRTLNFNFRKKQLEKIAYENLFLMEKLKTKEATVSLKKLNEEYLQSLKYKKNLAKKSFLEHSKKNAKFLPKIDYRFRALSGNNTDKSQKDLLSSSLE